MRFTWANRFRAGFNKALLGAGIALAVVALVLLVTWMLQLLSLADPLRLLR